MVNTKIRLIIFFAAKDGEDLYSQQKTRLRDDCGSDHEILLAKFRLKLKKVGKTTRHFSSVLFTCSVVSDSLWPHELQHIRPPAHHQPLESTQTHIYWVGDAIQPSHPLSPPSPPALNLSQNQDLFQWVSPSHEVAKVFTVFHFGICVSLIYCSDCLCLII